MPTPPRSAVLVVAEEVTVSALRDGDPIVRSHAVWAAARLGRRDLLGAVHYDRDPLLAAELARAVSPASTGAAL